MSVVLNDKRAIGVFLLALYMLFTKTKEKCVIYMILVTSFRNI